MLEALMRILLLLVGGFIVLGIVVDIFRKRKKQFKPRQRQLNLEAPKYQHPYQAPKQQQHYQQQGQQQSEPYLSSLSIPQEPEPFLGHHAEPQTTGQPQQSAKEEVEDDMMMIMLAAREQAFGGYDLLQSLQLAGLEFNAQQMFGYRDKVSGEILFNLVQASEPGTFDLERLGEINCRGLILFLNLAKLQHPEHAFNIMLVKAQQLADDLNADLLSQQQELWDERIARDYLAYISQHKERMLVG